MGALIVSPIDYSFDTIRITRLPQYNVVRPLERLLKSWVVCESRP